MSERKKLIVILLVAVVLLAACNLPSVQQKNQNAVYTEAALTVQAELTKKVMLVTLSATFPPLATFTSVPPSPTNLPANTPTATPICDLALYVNDVTIPDGTQFLPGQTFTKTWRLRNIGVCSWTSGYQVIFDNGDLMEGPSSGQALTGTVPSGAEVDISITLKSPPAPGSYRGYWRLRNPSNVLVPVVSGYLGTSFFVDIKVVPPSSTPTVTPTVTATATATITPTQTSHP